MRHHQAVHAPRQVYTYISWRYDKSKFNLIVKQYQRQHGTLLCPVKRALSIVTRALHLKLSIHTVPLGVFIGLNGQTYTILGIYVQEFLQEACVCA
jgi:hypothetical protein